MWWLGPSLQGPREPFGASMREREGPCSSTRLLLCVHGPRAAGGRWQGGCGRLVERWPMQSPRCKQVTHSCFSSSGVGSVFYAVNSSRECRCCECEYLHVKYAATRYGKL